MGLFRFPFPCLLSLQSGSTEVKGSELALGLVADRDPTQCRNGTIKSIKEIAHNLSSAKLGTRTPPSQSLTPTHPANAPLPTDPNTEVVVAPPSLYLLLAREHLDPRIEVASQNVFDRPNGAFTGEISVDQLRDSGITWTILGHSERRTILREEDAFIAKKTLTSIKGGIGVILCCGESLEEREAGTTVEVVTKQLDAVKRTIEKADWEKVVVAYEPIWAIGTGKVATTQQAQEVHEKIREWLKKEVGEDVAEQTRIIYGGSVSEKNCGDLAKEKDIDGFLVGGASLKPACEC